MSLTIQGVKRDAANGLNGIVVPTLPDGPAPQYSNLALPAFSRRWMLRLYLDETTTFASATIGIQTAATADDACSLGFYDASKNQLQTTGAITGKLNGAGAPNTANIDIADITCTGKTVYYVGFSVATPGGTAATLAGISMAGASYAKMFGTDAPTILMDAVGTSGTGNHPLPSSWGAIGLVSSAAPLIVLNKA